MDLRGADVSAGAVSTVHRDTTDDARYGIMSRLGDMPRAVHLPERDLCGDPDLSIGHLHRGGDLRRVRGDLFTKSHLPVLSILPGDSDVPDADMHRFGDLPGHNHMSGHEHVRSDSDLPAGIDLPGISLHDDGRTDLPWHLNMSWRVHVQRRQLRRLPDLHESDLHIRADLHRAHSDMLVHSHMRAVSIM